MGLIEVPLPCRVMRSAQLLMAIAVLATCFPASADAPQGDALQRIDQRLALKVMFHEKQKPPEVQDDGELGLGEEAMDLLTDVARIVVGQYGSAELPAGISAQFAVDAAGDATENAPPADVLTVAMSHLGDGRYAVAEKSRDALVSWFTEHGVDFVQGNISLLRVDGLPELDEKAMVFFDIEGECPVCESDVFSVFPVSSE